LLTRVVIVNSSRRQFVSFWPKIISPKVFGRETSASRETRCEVPASDEERWTREEERQPRDERETRGETSASEEGRRHLDETREERRQHVASQPSRHSRRVIKHSKTVRLFQLV